MVELEPVPADSGHEGGSITRLPHRRQPAAPTSVLHWKHEVLKRWWRKCLLTPMSKNIYLRGKKGNKSQTVVSSDCWHNAAIMWSNSNRGAFLLQHPVFLVPGAQMAHVLLLLPFNSAKCTDGAEHRRLDGPLKWRRIEVTADDFLTVRRLRNPPAGI